MEAIPPLLRNIRPPLRPSLHNLQNNFQSGFSSSSTASVSRAFSSAVSSSAPVAAATPAVPTTSSSVSSGPSVRPGPSIRATSSTCTLASGSSTRCSGGLGLSSGSSLGGLSLSSGGLFSSTPPRLGRMGRLQQSAQADVFDNPANDSYRVARRAAYPWQKELERDAWKFMHQNMIEHFRLNKPSLIDTTAHLVARSWPRFATKHMIEAEGRLPAIITKHGPDRQIVLKKEDLLPLAFDEEEGHLSHLFKGRMYKIFVEELGYDELCYIADCSVHMVDRKLFFVRFERHVPFKTCAQVKIPVTLAGMYGCPGQLKGGHIELKMPTIEVEVVGDRFPPPFLVDCSRLTLGPTNGMPYDRITLADLQPLLEPFKGYVRFSRKYTDPKMRSLGHTDKGYGYGLEDTEVVMCYDIKQWPEEAMPEGYDALFRYKNQIDTKIVIQKLPYSWLQLA